MPLNFDKTHDFVCRSGLFDLSARCMADMALRACNVKSAELYLLMALTVQALNKQHVCYQMKKFAGSKLVSADSGLSLTLPEFDNWCKALDKEELRGAVQIRMDHCLDDEYREAFLVIDHLGGCYLLRQWHYEQSITRALLARVDKELDLPELPEGYLNKLVTYFQDKNQHPALDCQQLAVLTALRHDLLVLTGGPGTGKTTVAAAILAIKLLQNKELKIALAAPTAKAARQLAESLNDNLPALNVPQEVKDIIAALQPSTLHQLLGWRFNSNAFKHNRNNPLQCDLLLIDECSMVPQNLMAQVVDALSDQTGLILLGDRFQLASVEAGSVLADICDAARVNCGDKVFCDTFADLTGWTLPEISSFEKERYPLAGAIVELTENHRFAASAPLLGDLAGMIRALDAESDFAAAAQNVFAMRGREFEFLDTENINLYKLLQQKLSVPRLVSGESFLDLKRLAADGSQESLAKAFEMLNTFKLLAPVYDGKYGIDKLNAMCMDIIGLSDVHQAGVPLMIRQNDYKHALFNGDIGLTACDENGNVKVFFEGHDRAFDFAMLPEYEVVFAMTVHKSQGSGFKDVLFVMPGYSSELINCEMVYTAMTRAKEHLTCIGSCGELAAALRQRTSRMSNLTMRLNRNSGDSLF